MIMVMVLTAATVAVAAKPANATSIQAGAVLSAQAVSAAMGGRGIVKDPPSPVDTVPVPTFCWSSNTPNDITTSTEFIFARGTEDALWYQTSNSAGFSSWQSLGGVLTSWPAATLRDQNTITVFVRGNNGAIYYRDYIGGSFGQWTSIGGQVAVGTVPTVCSWGGGRLDVFVKGTNGGMYHKSYTVASGWSGWDYLGGSLTSSPAATSRNPGGITVFARGTDGAVWYRDYVNSYWGNWVSIGGQVSTGAPAPSVCSWGGGRLDVFVTGTNLAVYHKSYSGSWSGWESLGGWTAYSPEAIASTQGVTVIGLYARGSDEGIWYNLYNEGYGWFGWSQWPAGG